MRVRALLLASLLIFSISSTCLALENSTVDYQLPYPGILPDNPLYPLKVLRDKIYDFFLRDPLKKAEFRLLMADKRLFMAIMLADRKKIQLAQQTISKSSKYYEEAVLTLYKAQKEGREITELRSRLIKAGEKHQEIILGLMEDSPEEIKRGLQESLERIVKYREELSSKSLNMQNVTSKIDKAKNRK